jgi:methylmalonyl-CoA carboxyltransferase 5S subunit
VEVTDLILRDAHQSLLATRMSTEDMLGACPDLDRAGYWSLECWGGATYDACIRFLNEDPWERLRTFRRLMPNSRLQMLLRGQNLLGYRHYADEVVDRFCERAAANGIDVFRIFDALNDIRNMERAITAVKKAGKHAQGTVCYTISPVHTVETFVDLALQLQKLGCDSICLKDMAALLKPQPAFHVHTHATTGVTLVSLQKAIEAGADMVDTAISSLCLGSGHNPTESLVEMLEGQPYHSRLDLDRIARARRHFDQVKPNYESFMSAYQTVDTRIFKSQIPGGMISNMENQLREQGAGDKLEQVLEEVPKVRQAAGYPPPVTPSSQIVGTQAVFNVLMGTYKVITSEFADLMLGYYGTTAAEKDPDVVQKAQASSDKESITCRPADLLNPEWAVLRSEALELSGCNGSDEDVLTYAMFPATAPKFFSERAQGANSVARPGGQAPVTTQPDAAAQAGEYTEIPEPVRYLVTLGDRTHTVTVEPM